MEKDKDLENLRGKQSDDQKRIKDFGNQSALAMELPFTLVGAALFGGLRGFLLD